MTQYAIAGAGADITSEYIQASDAETLADLVNKYLSTFTSGNIITAINLAGAGDGHSFVVMIESAESEADVDSGGLAAAGTQVTCYAAATGPELTRARIAAGSPTPFVNPSPPPDAVDWTAYDNQFAGGSQGALFLGLTVWQLSSLSPTFNTPSVMGAISGSLVAGENILTIDSEASVGFDDVGTQGVQWLGDTNTAFLADTTVLVQLTAASAFPAHVTLAFVVDPLGTPVVVKTMEGVVLAANGFAPISLPVIVGLTTPAFSVPGSKLGIRLTVPAGGAGSITAGRLRVVQQP